jgi:arylformamidase
MSYVYRSFTREQIDKQYDVTANIVNRDALIRRFVDDSKQYAFESPCELDVAFGAHVDERADIFYPKKLLSPAPVVVFIHGGYWHKFTKQEWSFIAASLCERGAIVVVPTYSLCPKVCVSEILRQMQRFIAWLHGSVQAHGGDPSRLFLSGHSAGGYMAVSLLLTDWQREYGMPNDVIKGVTTISGVYDLEPLQYSYLQSTLHLDNRELCLLSMTEPLQVYRGRGDINCFVGSGESCEFIRQSRELSERWWALNHSGVFEVLPGRNHLDILFELSEPNGRILEKLVAQMEL